MQKNKQRGFTLIEVLTVMLVLVAIASVTIEVSSDLAFQKHYETTQDRYQKIRQAIIGTDTLINGQPDLSGFVADMGRLPRNLHELLVKDYCSNDYTISANTPDAQRPAGFLTHQAWCEGKTPAGTWIVQTDRVAPTSSTLGYGWQGPYLTTSHYDYEGDALADSWGNKAASDLTDQNYGWQVVHFDNAHNVLTGINSNLVTIDNAVELNIQSLGKDGTVGGSQYDADYPQTSSLPSITWDDWTVEINNLLVNMHLSAGSHCDITHLSPENACGAAGQSWLKNVCQDTSITTSASCIGGTLQWQPLFSLCFDSAKTTAASCIGANDLWIPGQCYALDSQTQCESLNWASWDTTTSQCLSTSRDFCQRYLLPSSSQTLDLVINYRIRGGLTTLTVSTSIEESGSEKMVSFNVNNRLPLGINKIAIYKTLTTDIYPPACINLSSAACLAADNPATDAVLLANHYCDNVTVAECVGAGGKMLRQDTKIPFVPHTNLSMVNW